MVHRKEARHQEVNKNIIIGITILSTISILGLRMPHKETVNVYGWYGIIPKDILRKFEEETGIRVIYDVYDSNETLETKLLTNNSGYDVVFPSYTPYGARQCVMGAYTKLDYHLIPNIQNIAGALTEKYTDAGGDQTVLVPIFWGTIGIAYNAKEISKIFPGTEMSYELLLNEEHIRKLSRYGVSFPEEYIDIFPQTAVFLNIMDNKSFRAPEKIQKYMEHFKSIRKYIKKFSSQTLIKDLQSGEVVVAIGCSDNAWRAIKSAKKVGHDIRYVVPERYGVLWIDCVGIPKSAPHKRNAHAFINYLLRPDVSAQITNTTGILVNIPKARKYFCDKIKSTKYICPREGNEISNLFFNAPCRNANESRYERIATRAWSKIRSNTF